ncbi:disulfide bond formation protein B [Shewanella sp. NKUCC01_JLK]|uniref:disulfide bond formation protein B n=1 Tax=Shewanella sp. NKUCC01_JLK TaxID=2842123 RepID=UPI001C5B4FF6|nr:disulfide bond formation protein B [Shewanella sp. NKUCC01_JLK]MBW3517187.1 disulfide bond formation protein B [Shewanella sp. NKUCC01_JLK]
MSFFSKALSEFKTSPFQTLSEWQNQRWVWFLMSSAAAFLILSAIGYFQLFLAMDPCEICVYIRYSQFCILFAGLIIAIKPTNIWFKIIGMYIAWYGVLQGMAWSIDLAELHHTAHALDDVMLSGGDLFAVGGGAAACSTEPTFPLGLPLHVWLPFEFQPSGICGEDDWSLLGLNMAEYCIIAYVFFIIGLGAATIGWIYKFLKSKNLV